jgi:hypothetical protein
VSPRSAAAVRAAERSRSPPRGLVRAFEAGGLERPARGPFEPLNQASALFWIKPKKGLENKLDGVRTLLGHDNRVRWAAPAADISRAEQQARTECAEARKINPEAHGGQSGAGQTKLRRIVLRAEHRHATQARM